MDKRLKALQILASCSDGNWKIGKSDSYIATLSSKISALPAGVFDSFYINPDEGKKISTVDFALMTHDMAREHRQSLMSMYGIEPGVIDAIVSVADGIADLIDIEKESEHDR